MQPTLHRRTREAPVEPSIHTKKAVEADELARFVKADQIAASYQIQHIAHPAARLPIRTSSRIWSSLKVAAGSKYLVELRLRIQSMMALVMVIPLVMMWVKG